MSLEKYKLRQPKQLTSTEHYRVNSHRQNKKRWTNSKRNVNTISSEHDPSGNPFPILPAQLPLYQIPLDQRGERNKELKLYPIIQCNHYPFYISTAGYGNIQIDTDFSIDISFNETLRLQFPRLRFSLSSLGNDVCICMDDQIKLLVNYRQSILLIDALTGKFADINAERLLIRKKDGSSIAVSSDGKLLSSALSPCILGDPSFNHLLKESISSAMYMQLHCNPIVYLKEGCVTIMCSNFVIHYDTTNHRLQVKQSSTITDLPSDITISYDVNDNIFSMEMMSKEVAIEIKSEYVKVNDSTLGTLTYYKENELLCANDNVILQITSGNFDEVDVQFK